MNDKVGFGDSDHGTSLHIAEDYFAQPGGHIVPTKVRLLSPFEHLIDFCAGTFFVTVGDGFALGAGDLLGITTGTAFLLVTVLPSAFEEIKSISIFEIFFSFEIGIKNVAIFPEIFPDNLFVFE